MLIADLHIHSRFSRATSRDGTPEQLDLWARKKGIHIVGTGDFTHPAWRQELEEKLTPAEEGLYVLKEEFRIHDPAASETMIPRFVITGEISSIYKKKGKVRKVHNLILLPGMEEAQIAAKKLEAVGNIHSDGRPILGMDCRDLLELFLETSGDAIFVPAHIWTPHFSVFGAFSGFNSMEECFEDLTSHIRAVETGLSSDPPMNWRVSALDAYHLISNSDAHSPAKLGREANLLDIPMAYAGIREAIQEGNGLCGTIEFFPEEGKYHFDGHRKCGVCLTPIQAREYGGICPVCGKKLTIGVSHRVEDLADRAEGIVGPRARPFESIMPLPEAIGSCLGCSASSAKVGREYQRMLQKLGSEFDILRKVPVEDIRRVCGGRMAEGIRRLRNGQVETIPGFDGEYGKIRLFSPNEQDEVEGQLSLMDLLGGGNGEIQTNDERDFRNELAKEPEEIAPASGLTESAVSVAPPKGVGGQTRDQMQDSLGQLNEEQRRAVCSMARHVAVSAGPGTGKTKTMVSHLAYLLEARRVKPSQITAVTFTNQAAGEMRIRIQRELGKKRRLGNMRVGTFHALCLEFLRQQGVEAVLTDEREAGELAKQALEDTGLSMSSRSFLSWVSKVKAGISRPDGLTLEETERRRKAMARYQELLAERNRMDFDDLLLKVLAQLEPENGDADRADPAAIRRWREGCAYLLVDEFQDINPIQYRLMKAWNAGGRELFVIGDPDQSIYGFRGADAACFDRLREDFPDLEQVRLLKNYRSTSEIIKAALAVIEENPGGQRRLEAVGDGRTGIPVRIVEGGSEKSAAIFAAKEINRLTGGIGMLEAHEAAAHTADQTVWGFGDIAVLYRTHRQAELLEKCLRQESIPYVVAGRESFLEADSVQGTLNFFQYLLNQEDSYAGERAQRLLWGLDENPLAHEILQLTAQEYRPLVCGREKPRLLGEMGAGKKSRGQCRPWQILNKWINQQGFTQDPAMKKLENMSVFYDSMEALLFSWKLGVESDVKRWFAGTHPSEAVTLMTMHGSKGLEFPVVLLCGVQKGTVPLEHTGDSVDSQEERRLLYVGMTRAKSQLILTVSGEESPFLKPLTHREAVRENMDVKKKQETYHQLSLFEEHRGLDRNTNSKKISSQ